MNNISMKKLLYIICVLALSIASAQKPFVNSIDKTTGTANELVTISGSGFTAPTVYFGSGRATSVTVISPNLLEVRVPATATYGFITVRNSNGLSTSSSQLFTLSFDKDFAGNNYSLITPSAAQSTGQILSYDICMCDFDGDNLLDAAISNQNATSTINLIKNTTTVAGTYSFSAPLSDHDFQDVTGTGNYTPFYIECGDLNGDGKPELVVSSNSPTQYIHVYTNSSSGVGNFNFTTHKVRLELPTLGGIQRTTNRVRVADFDGDGKPDIVVGSTTANDQSIFIFRNNTTLPGNPSFVTTPIEVNFGGSAPGGVVYPGDFDQDGKMDLVIGSSSTTGVLTVMRNTSLPGAISFENKGTIGGSATRPNLLVGDFNDDGLPDIVSTRRTGSDGGSVEMLRNNGNFSFTANASNMASTTISPYGLDLGDMNGDGLPDIVVASLSNEVVYFENSTTSATITFENANTIATSQARNVKVGDVDNDGKPDIAFVDASVTGVTGEFRYIINDQCLTPVIQETGSSIYCFGDEFILTATAGQGVTYEWNISGGTTATVNTGTTNSLDISIYSTNITVSVTSTAPDGSCANTSASRNFTVGGTGAAAPTINAVGLICAGDVLTLTTPNNTFTNYYWSGPNGFSESTNVSTIEVSASASAIHSGAYTLTVDDGDCQSPSSAPINVEVSSPPATAIQFSACDGGDVTLAVPDYNDLLDLTFPNLISYQWLLGATPVGAASTLVVDATLAGNLGEYTLVLTDGEGCELTTEIFDLNASTFTGPSFTAPNEICVDVETTFTAGQAGLSNTWEIEDPAGSVTETLTGNSIQYTFTTTGTKIVRLITQYTNGIGCNEKSITVSAEPAYTADVSAPGITKCPSEEVTLSFSEADIVSYTWDDLDATSGPLLVTAAGTYTATYTTDTGCEIVAPGITITNLPGLNLSADSPAIVSGTPNTLELAQGQTSVVLSVDSDVVNPVWNIVGAGSIDGTGASVTVVPGAPTVTVTVTGQTAEGCDESESVEISGGGPRPRKTFSPNGDNPDNDCWQIVNSSGLTDCEVYILDTRGAIVYKAKLPMNPQLGPGPDCIWEGNFNGKAAPEGVYFFVVKCADGSQSLSGSILLAR